MRVWIKPQSPRFELYLQRPGFVGESGSLCMCGSLSGLTLSIWPSACVWWTLREHDGMDRQQKGRWPGVDVFTTLSSRVGAGKIIVCEMCIIYCNKTTSTMRSDRWDVFFSVICCVSGRGRVNVNTDKWVFNSRGLYEGLFCPGWTHILVTHRFVHAHSRLWHKTSLSLTLSVSPSDVHANTQTKRLPLRE